MKQKYISFLRYQVPALFWAVCIYAASSIPARRIPWYFLKTLDKLIHVGIFTILGLLVYRAFGKNTTAGSFSYKKVLLMLGIVIFYGILDELHQGSTPGRTVDTLDLMADAIGGLLAGSLLYVRHFLKRGRASE